MYREAMYKEAQEFILFLALVLLFAFHYLWPETIPAGNGFGYDGKLYAEMARRLDEMIRGGEVSPYYAQRVLPSLIVGKAVAILGMEPSSANIIQAFRYLNQFLIFLSFVFWVKISRRLHLGTAAFWVGAAGLFFCFPNAKEFYYYPVSTDTFAFFVGCGLAWAAISRNLTLLLALSILGSLAWQITGIICALLILSLVVQLGFSERKGPGNFPPESLKRAAYLATIAASALLASVIILVIFFGGLDLDRILLGRNLKPETFTRLLTNLPVLTLVALGCLDLIFHLLSAGPCQRPSSARVVVYVAAAAALLLIPSIVKSQIANPELPGGDGLVGIIKAMLLTRVSDGMVFLPIVAHAVYFGPVFLVAMARWPSVIRSAGDLGLGYLIVVLLFLGFSIFSESRFNTLLWPFIVVVTALAVDKKKPSKAFLVVFAVVSVLFSKFWLRINQAPWPEPDMSFLQDWPKSLFFSHFGPWMNCHFYISQGIFVAVLLVLMTLMSRESVPKTRDQRFEMWPAPLP